MGSVVALLSKLGVDVCAAGFADDGSSGGLRNTIWQRAEQQKNEPCHYSRQGRELLEV